MTLPPHCSNRLQPLDQSWKNITINHIPSILNKAYNQAFTTRNIHAGFIKTVIHPFNLDVFSDDFVPCNNRTTLTQNVIDYITPSTSAANTEVQTHTVHTLSTHTTNKDTGNKFSPLTSETTSTKFQLVKLLVEVENQDELDFLQAHQKKWNYSSSGQFEEERI
ncbi:hypothetical protein PR048_011501 [Dryococelus australis]|uniref:Uncharacterized protein n=1 Tax=Dryococelus australis TaxID=614101 RepID=A0ABQ9HLS4_9NEOP|nr:hypothetical protein PR048_011501 [Dryococelus australis]